MSDLANLYISPRLAAREILSALRGTVLVADIDGKVLYQREGSRKISGEHIDIIVTIFRIIISIILTVIRMCCQVRRSARSNCERISRKLRHKQDTNNMLTCLSVA